MTVAPTYFTGQSRVGAFTPEPREPIALTVCKFPPIRVALTVLMVPVAIVIWLAGAVRRGG